MKWINKNKVFLLGLLGSIAVVIQQFTLEPTVDWKAVGFAVLMATLSYFANAWRGQGVSLLGILGTLAGVFVSMQTTGHFTWNQFIVSVIAALLSAVAPPPKLATYETNSNIVEAKQQPPVEQVKDTSPTIPTI